MSTQTLRAGFAGSGFAAAFHYEALKRVYTARVEVAGVFSATQKNRDAFAQKHGIKAYESLDTMLQECDVVHVCTPPITHEPIIVEALRLDKHVIVEKPFTGYFGDGSESFNGDTFPRATGLQETLKSINRMLEAERNSGAKILYAENWIYSPVIQKERDIIEKTGGQILWMHGEESHSGSHSISYGQWALSGGGSMIGKGCHPLSAALYFKQVEGRVRNGKAIRPKTITARTHALTRHPNFQNDGYLRTTYKDTEDFAMMHITFEDGTIATIFASELLLGGVNNWIEIAATNHRTKCMMSQNDSVRTYTPSAQHFKEVYTIEKIETKEGWSNASPDEGWFNGYQHELNAFYDNIANGTPIESNSQLAADTIATIYAGYLSAEKEGAAVAITLL